MYFKLIFFIILTSTIYANSIKVAVAANVRFAFDEISKAYMKKNDIKIIPIVSSSGKLTAQIEHGAPFDLFLSANMKYPKYLFNKNLATTEPKIYAFGTLVLWSLSKKVTIDLKNLNAIKIKKIAIPNPKNAPYGIEALKVLKKYYIKEEIYHKIVFGESISQTNQYIYSQSADIGITAKSVVLSPKMKSIGRWKEINKNDYNPIKQGIVILKHGYKKNQKKSLDFYNFIFSKEGQKILKKYGYILP